MFQPSNYDWGSSSFSDGLGLVWGVNKVNFMKKVLVTGGTGFIGRNILESFLNEKYDFIAPTQQELDLIDSKKVEDFFKKNKIDIVIHAADKPAHRNAPDLTNIFYTDMQMIMNVIRNSNYYEKMIVLSSGSIYDKCNYEPKMKETYFDKYVPSDEHGFYRYVSAKIIEKMSNIIELRIFGIFGKYEYYAIRFISNAICKAIFDLPITIKQNKKFDYLYINDLIPILDHFMENDVSYKAYNVSPGNSVDLYSLAKIIKKISGKDLPIIIKKPGIGLEYSADNSRLEKEIPDIKFAPIESSIKELYQWYTENKNLINKESLLIDK